MSVTDLVRDTCKSANSRMTAAADASHPNSSVNANGVVAALARLSDGRSGIPGHPALSRLAQKADFALRCMKE